jgi:F-box and WD-40 domain protein 1/11
LLTGDAEYAYRLVRTLPTSHIASLVDRLVPILYLDFVQILPSELSLQILSYLPPKSLLNASLASRTWRKFALEPRLWRILYKRQGWEADEEEVKKFETELQTRQQQEALQQMESKRKAEEIREGERKVKEVKRSASHSQSSGLGSSQSMDTSGEWSNDVVEPEGTDPLDVAYGTAPGATTGPSTFYPGGMSGLSDDEEMYPTPQHRPTIMSPAYSDPPLVIQPTLTTPGYGYPRLNWAFLFKNRKRLEENWVTNRCVPFEIPHPNYPHEGHRECIYTIQYSSKWLCSGSRDNTIRVWNIKTRRLRGEPLQGHNGSVLCLQFDESPDEDVIISGSSDSSVIVWRFSTGERLQMIPKAHDESVLNLRFNKKWLVTCSKDKLIKVWNRVTLETQDADYPWHSKLLFGSSRGAAANHPDNPNYQPTWNVQDPTASSGLSLLNPFNSKHASRTPKFIPKTLPPYTATQDLVGHVAAVNAIQLHGDEIVSASGDRVIKLWNRRTGLCEKTFVGHQKGIACIQFDGKTIVSGSSDHTIRVFDRDTQAEIATLRGHTALVRTVQATYDKIVSGSYDESVRIWRRDLETGDWVPGPVLRQAVPPMPAPPVLMNTPGGNAHAHAQLQMMHLQAFQASQLGGNAGAVQMHQVQHVGPGLAGAVAAAQLLPNPHPHHPLGQLHQQQQQPPQQPPQQPQQQPPQQPQQQPQQQQQQQPGATPTGSHRVFKLQFDARWIICCSQDSRIVGWDYAADEEPVIEASRFFIGGS